MRLTPITLENGAFEGNNTAYLLESAGTTALVDTGVARDDVRDQLESRLADHGTSFADVDLVILTHFHSDHAGLSGTIRRAGDARVLVHEDDAALTRGDDDAFEALYARQDERFDEWGMPAEKRDTVRPILQNQGAMDFPEAVETVTDGDEIAVGDVTLRVVHSPGHTAGLSAFEFETDDDGLEAFVGDVILPVYTPNVGGADLRVERPLEQYLETLARIADREYDRAWPGHRDVIDDPTDRAETIVEHHHDRTERVVDVLDEEGPATAWEVSDALFGELQRIHILHGPGEAFAHLDHLENHGVVERTTAGYRLIDGSPDLDEIV